MASAGRYFDPCRSTGYTLAVMPTVEQSRPSAEDLGSILEFETLIADLSSRFINLPHDELDREIADALRRVSELLGLDSGVLWQWSATAPVVITPTHFHYAQEGLQPPQPLSQEHFPWVVQQMRAGRMVVIPSLEKLPAEAAVDREAPAGTVSSRT